MKATEILMTRPPLVAAQELVRRGFDKRDDFALTANRWLELLEVQAPDDEDWAAMRTWALPRLEAVRSLLRAARRYNIESVLRVLALNPYPNADDLRLAVSLATTEDAAWALVLWAPTATFVHLAGIADVVADDLALCTRVFGPPSPRPCGCGKHLEDGIRPWVRVLVARRRRGLSADLALIPGDAGPAESWLSDERLLLAQELQEVGIEIPGVTEVARAWLAGRMWPRALRWLAGVEDAREACVAALVERVKGADDVRVPLNAAAGNDAERFLGAGTFVGRGWGRTKRARLLKPLAIALLDREAWPLAELRALLKPARSDVTVEDYTSGLMGRGVERRNALAHEQVWTQVQEILAEALLAIALDEARVETQRRRAVHALGTLRPGGDGSWAKLLSRLKGGPLGGDAHEAQVAMREGAPDAELAIGDALGVYFERSDAAET